MKLLQALLVFTIYFRLYECDSVESNNSTIEHRVVNLVINGPVLNNGSPLSWDSTYSDESSTGFLNLDTVLCAPAVYFKNYVLNCTLASLNVDSSGRTIATLKIKDIMPLDMVDQTLISYYREESKRYEMNMDSDELNIVSSLEVMKGSRPSKLHVSSVTVFSDAEITINWDNDYPAETYVFFLHSVTNERFTFQDVKTATVKKPGDNAFYYGYAQNLLGVSDREMIDSNGVLEILNFSDSDLESPESVDSASPEEETIQATQAQNTHSGNTPTPAPNSNGQKKKTVMTISGPVMKDGVKIPWNPLYEDPVTSAFAELQKSVCSFELPLPLVKAGCKIISAREGSTVVETDISVISPDTSTPDTIYSSIQEASPALKSPEMSLVASSEYLGYPPTTPLIQSFEEDGTLMTSWSNDYEPGTKVIIIDVKSGKKFEFLDTKSAKLPIVKKPYKFRAYAENVYGVSESITFPEGPSISYGAILLSILGIFLFIVLIVIIVICCLSFHWARKKQYPDYVPQKFRNRVNTIVNGSAEEKRAEFESTRQIDDPPSYA